ncbi:MAG: SUMF1/EgtB/PvdO family nonheme iron enzyme [Thiohalocapsa sp.]
MNDSRPDALQTWLEELPFWSDDNARRVFVDDLLWQLDSVDLAHGNTGSSGDSAVVARICAGPSPGGDPAAADLLLGSVLDRGFSVKGSPLLGCSEESSSRTIWRMAPMSGDRRLQEPYPGPRPFRCDEAPLFFGRGLETRTLLRKLAAGTGRLVLVAGRSGSGKRSLVQAGLMAALARGGVPGLDNSEDWPVALTSLSDGAADPVARLIEALTATGTASGSVGLADADRFRKALHGNPAAWSEFLELVLAGMPTGARWVIVIDGLEQLLLDVRGTHRRVVFDVLKQALRLPRVRVVATLRAEFLVECIETPLLREAVDAGGLLSLPTPSQAQLGWMLRGPRELLGEDAAHGLPEPMIQALVSESLLEPVPLLYLATRARAIYAREKGSTSTVVGARWSFDDWCDQALTEAGDPDAVALPRVLSRLVRVENSHPPIARSERLVHWDRDPIARRVIDALSDDGRPLLRIQEEPVPRVHLAHESLFESWRRLALWVERLREAQRMESRLRVDLVNWQKSGCPDHLRWPDELLDPARSLFSASGLLDSLERDLLTADFLTPESERLLMEILCSRTDDASREDIGLRLARIGDPRPGVLASRGCPVPYWCHLPGGVVFINGRDEIRVEPFMLARHPVTLGQYDAFVCAEDGFLDDRWWSGLERRPLEGWNATRRCNYPATQLSWHDATAYCRWLAARLGLEVRLPDEWEWQWAAQSARDDFVYPWGCDWLAGRANTDEAGVGRTIAVGMYPAGQSLQGVDDLAGNIWEWCRSAFHLSGGLRTEDLAAARSARVIRGGSWRVNRGFARADFRLDAMPGDRVGSTGFRVACSVNGACETSPNV